MQRTGNAIATLAAIVFVAGLVAGGYRWGDDAAQAQHAQQQAEKHAFEMQQARINAMLDLQEQAAMRPFMRAAKGTAVGGAVVLALLTGFYVVMNLRKRSRLIYADDHGLFPNIEIILSNGAAVVHDPNKAPTSTTVYRGRRDGRIVVTPVILPGLVDHQRAATAQGATVQAARAAVSGSGLVGHVQEVVKRLLPALRSAERVDTDYGALTPLTTLHSELSGYRAMLTSNVLNPSASSGQAPSTSSS
jgi:hypothetical protein